MSAVNTSLGAALQTGTPTSSSLPRWPYEMRPLSTEADRTAAAALVEDRTRWLAERDITIPHHAAAFRDPRAEAVGLYKYVTDDEEDLVGCLLLHRQPDIQSWSTAEDEPGLSISLVHTAPGRDDEAGGLITLWASGFAARTGARWVHAEVPSRHAGSDATVGRLLAHLGVGWHVTGSGLAQNRARIVRLRLPAQDRSGLAAFLHCSVPIQTPANPAVKEVCSR